MAYFTNYFKAHLVPLFFFIKYVKSLITCDYFLVQCPHIRNTLKHVTLTLLLYILNNAWPFLSTMAKINDDTNDMLSSP